MSSALAIANALRDLKRAEESVERAVAIRNRAEETLSDARAVAIGEIYRARRELKERKRAEREEFQEKDRLRNVQNDEELLSWIKEFNLENTETCRDYFRCLKVHFKYINSVHDYPSPSARTMRMREIEYESYLVRNESSLANYASKLGITNRSEIESLIKAKIDAQLETKRAEVEASRRALETETIRRRIDRANAERAETEERYKIACLEAEVAGKPLPFRGPAADSLLGELFLNILPIVCAHGHNNGHGLELFHTRYICGLTYRKGDKGATSDMIQRATEKAAPWLSVARKELRVHKKNRTKLQVAAMKGNEKRVRELIAAGVDLDQVCEIGTALHCVAACTKNFRRLVARGYNTVNVARSQANIVTLLLNGKYEGKGANINARNARGATPLMMACYRSNKAVVIRLLENGADVNLISDEGWTALNIIGRNSNGDRDPSNIEEVLRKYGAI